ncbi:hypothetical protein O181_114856 [Austropuccinia psidii MF-1]|uniref:Uncharacterized protein n=1 Tax=Austropuccinia psidii MF-1 TaxID=1389203 RepID=A0A9Q3K7N8_9BASI|nr:hypothetical protein [Austropuccinia psidii MF-1]
MEANTTNTSDMGPQKQFKSPESSGMECSLSEIIISISIAIPNPPPELPEGMFFEWNLLLSKSVLSVSQLIRNNAQKQHRGTHAHWASSTEIYTEVLFGAKIKVIKKEQFLKNSSQMAPRLEGMSKDSCIPQYVQEKIQEARELLVSDIYCMYKKIVITYISNSTLISWNYNFRGQIGQYTTSRITC